MPAEIAFRHIETVRVHDTDGLLSIAPLRMPSRPNALAWLSLGGHFTWGWVDVDLQLRHYSYSTHLLLLRHALGTWRSAARAGCCPCNPVDCLLCYA